MPRKLWPLLDGRPSGDVTLVSPSGGPSQIRHLIADTGAGTALANFELLLIEQDCINFGAAPSRSVHLGGAYSGLFSIYLVRIQIPAIGFDGNLPVVGVQSVPSGCEGIACFRFLNRFHFGNFGDPDQFGLEI
jgi:hypothetical protein